MGRRAAGFGHVLALLCMTLGACQLRRDAKSCGTCTAQQSCVDGQCRDACVLHTDCRYSEICDDGLCLPGTRNPGDPHHTDGDDDSAPGDSASPSDPDPTDPIPADSDGGDPVCTDADSDGHCHLDDCDDHRAAVWQVCDAWWSSGWTRRARLSFQQQAVSETLTNFPVMVRLTAARFDYAAAASAGADLRFIDADGVTLLPYEVASWNNGGESVIWVKVPTVSGNSNVDHVWMYYGNPAASSIAVPASVWSDNFDAVWHMEGGVADSTGNLSSPTVDTSVDAVGQSGRGRQYQTNTYTTYGYDKRAVQNAAGATVSTWVKCANTTDLSSIVAVSVAGTVDTNFSRINLLQSGAQVQEFLRATETEAAFTPFTTGAWLVAGTWQYLTAVVNYATGTTAIYVDGSAAPLDQAAHVFEATHTSDLPARHVTIGAEDSASNSFFNGVVDEVRIARVARSAAWVLTDQRSVNDTLIVFAATESF